MTLEEMKVIIRAETKQYRDELMKMQTQTKSATAEVERQTSKIKGCLSSIGKVVAGLGVGYGLFRLGKQALGYASDLQEVQNVVDVAFGEMSYKMEKFAQNSIKQFGLSELTAKRTGSIYMAMGKGIGLASEEASNMALNLTALSADMSSFFNVSQSEVDTALKAIYTGETESIKRFGVAMTEINMEEYARQQGIYKSIEAMTQSEKVMLRYKYVTEQLSMANGDFARTSGSWANQVRIMQEQWKQLMGIIGNGLVAVFTPIIRVINTVIGKIIQFAQVVQAVFSSLFGNKGKSPGEEAKKIGSNLGSAESNATGLNNQLDKTSGKAKQAAKAMGQLASIDEINNMSTSSSGGSAGDSGSSVPNVGGIDSLSGWGDGLDEKVDTSGIDKTVKKIKKKLEELKSFLKNNGAIITSIMAGVVASLGALWMIKNWSELIVPIKNIFINMSALIGLIKDVGFIETFSSLFLGISAPMLAVVVAIGAVVGALVYLWQTSDGFRSAVSESLESLMGVLNNAYQNILVPLFGFIKDVFNTILIPLATFIAQIIVKAVEAVSLVVMALWNNILVPIANFLVDALSIALQGVIEVWNAWKPAIETIGGSCKWVWDNVLSPLVDWIVNTFITTFKKWGEVIDLLIPNIKEIFKGLVDFFVGIFTLDIERAMSGVQQIFEGFSNYLETIFSIDWSTCFGAIGDVMNGFYASISEIWDSIKKIFNGIIDFVVGVFTGDWSRAWQGIKGIFSGIFDGFAAIAKAPLNAVIGVFNGFLSGINWCIRKINSISVDLPDWLGGAHIGFNIQELGKINYLARGGVVDKPTPAIFGEAGAEAVIPLENNTGWMSKIAHGISSKMGGFTNSDLEDLLILIQELIDVTREKESAIYIDLDEDKLNGVNRKADRLRKLRTG